MGWQRIGQDWATFTFTATSGQIIESWKLLSQKYWGCDYDYIDYVKQPQIFSCFYLFLSLKTFTLFFNCSAVFYCDDGSAFIPYVLFPCGNIMNKAAMYISFDGHTHFFLLETYPDEIVVKLCTWFVLVDIVK